MSNILKLFITAVFVAFLSGTALAGQQGGHPKNIKTTEKGVQFTLSCAPSKQYFLSPLSDYSTDTNNYVRQTYAILTGKEPVTSVPPTQCLDAYPPRVVELPVDSKLFQAHLSIVLSAYQSGNSIMVQTKVLSEEIEAGEFRYLGESITLK